MQSIAIPLSLRKKLQNQTDNVGRKERFDCQGKVVSAGEVASLTRIQEP